MRKQKRDKLKKKYKKANSNFADFVLKARKAAVSLCESEGFELVHLEYLREITGRVLRVYIDKPGGINLDDCVYIGRQLSGILDIIIEKVNPII